MKPVPCQSVSHAGRQAGFVGPKQKDHVQSRSASILLLTCKFVKTGTTEKPVKVLTTIPHPFPSLCSKVRPVTKKPPRLHHLRSIIPPPPAVSRSTGRHSLIYQPWAKDWEPNCVQRTSCMESQLGKKQSSFLPFLPPSPRDKPFLPTFISPVPASLNDKGVCL